MVKKHKNENTDVTFTSSASDYSCDLVSSLFTANSFTFKGVVATKAELDKMEKETGVIYYVADEDLDYLCTGNSFESLGSVKAGNDLTNTNSCDDNKIKWEELD